MVWSCYSQQLCECRLLPAAPSIGVFRRLLTSITSEQDLFIEWPKLVSQYSSKGLTCEKDRLLAISGLATLMKRHTSSSYVAGMWTEDMEYSLLWMTDDKNVTRPITRRTIDAEEASTLIPSGHTKSTYAPSWSWASMNGPIKYHHRHLDQLRHRRSGEDELKPILRVLDVNATPLTSNHFGPVKDGAIKVEGQLLDIHYHPLRRVWRPGARTWSNLESFLEVNVPELQAMDPRIEPHFVYDVPREDSPEINRMVALFGDYALLRAAAYLWGGAWSTTGTEVVALLLVRVGDDPPVYKRRGIVFSAFEVEKVWKNVPNQVVTIL
jgi:hypothetical protein